MCPPSTVTITPDGPEPKRTPVTPTSHPTKIGRFEVRRFLGEVDHVLIAVSGLDKPLAARVSRPGTLREGEDVGVDIATDEVLVFPAGDT